MQHVTHRAFNHIAFRNFLTIFSDFQFIPYFNMLQNFVQNAEKFKMDFYTELFANEISPYAITFWLSELQTCVVNISTTQVASTNWRRAIAYVNANKSEEDIKEWTESMGRDDDLTPGRYIHLIHIHHWLIIVWKQCGFFTKNRSGQLSYWFSRHTGIA